jgi:hypothetical protein
MCVGVTVWFGWGGVVSLCRLKLVYLYSSIKMMHGLINIRLKKVADTCLSAYFSSQNRRFFPVYMLLVPQVPISVDSLAACSRVSYIFL